MRGVLKNDVILALKNQQPPPQELAGVLLEMLYDKEQDPVIRNYALQHLATWYDQCAEKAPVLDALWAGTTDADASIVGTALIGLSRLAQRSADFQPASASGAGFQPVSEIDAARLATAASAVATDPTANDVARTTALQVCAELGIKDMLPAAVRLAESAGSVPLRMSALAAVGALGGADQAAFLNRMLAADDPRIQTAARARCAAWPPGQTAESLLMKLTPKKPLALLLLGTTLAMWAQNNPPTDWSPAQPLVAAGPSPPIPVP